MKCPKCELEQPATNLECPRCGVVFDKIGADPESRAASEAHQRGEAAIPRERHPSGHGPRRSQPGALVPASVSGSAGGMPGLEISERSVPVTEPEEQIAPEPRSIDPGEWLVLGSGALIAGVAFAIPFVRHTFSTLMVLVHEMGHCLFNWIFGYPSLPAFDLVYGGGVALSFQRSSMILVAVYVFLGFAVYFYRRNFLTVLFIAFAGVIHAILAFTSAHQVVILFMGHGTELAIAGIFFYRALSGSAVIHSIERPLYAAIAFFIVLSNLTFAYGLMTSPLARMAYEDEKGGGHWMDFSRIAEDYLRVRLARVATFFSVCCFFPLALGFLTFRYQEHLSAALAHLFSRDSGQKLD